MRKSNRKFSSTKKSQTLVPLSVDEYFGVAKRYAKEKKFRGDEIEYALEQEAKEIAREGLD